MIRAVLAGHRFIIEHTYDDLAEMFRDYRYDADAVEPGCSCMSDAGAGQSGSCMSDSGRAILIRVTDEEIMAEDDPEIGYPPAYLETLAVYRKIAEALIPEDILLFHSSALSYRGHGLLLAAPSGTGKSTHARLWRERYGSDVVMVNDDKPLLSCADGSLTVYGTPYGGKDNLQNNIHAEVEAIVFLHQAAANEGRRLDAHEALPLLMKQTYRSSDPQKLLRELDLLERISRQIPVYSLGCTMDPEAPDYARRLVGLE